MLQIILGSFILSLIHALIPNHWVPIILISKAEKWKQGETLWTTAIISFSHTISTIALGIVIGIIGIKLSDNYNVVATVIAPLVLIFMGLVYFALDHKHSSHDHFPDKKVIQKKSKAAIVITLCIAMFFSPCLEIETYYFTAGTFGWKGILVVSVIYLTITLSFMTLLVWLGCKGVDRFNWHFLEHHEGKITGSVLILLGIISFFVKY